MKLNTALSLVSLFLVSVVFAGPADKNYASLGKIKPLTVSSTKGAEASIVLNVMKGFHIQANPASNPQLIATTLTVEPSENLTAGAPVYPPGKAYRLAATGTEVMTYDGKILITLPVTAAATAKPGQYELKGKLRYQACNEKTCFFPMVLDVNVPVTVTP
jgi:thiol:disulfide interchange protein DsbD